MFLVLSLIVRAAEMLLMQSLLHIEVAPCPAEP